MDAIRRALLIAAVVLAAGATSSANADQQPQRSAGLQIQVSVVVLGRCDIGSAPAQPVQCRRGVVFLDKPAVLEPIVDPADPDRVAPVMVREVAF